MTKEMLKTTKEADDKFDVMKAILAVFVVAIHSSLYPMVLYPWLRIAVPLFFMMSGYFFFDRINMKDSDQDKKKYLNKFVKRNLHLYVFWFVALLPITLIIKKYFLTGFVDGISRLVRDFLFASTFVASWYIIASTVAVIVIFYISKKMKNVLLLLFTLIIYLCVCFWSSYDFIIEDSQKLIMAMSLYIDIFSVPYNSFPVALFWIACGKCFADQFFDIGKVGALFLTVVSATLLYGEWILVRYLNNSYNNDCYVFLAPLCIGLFLLLKQMPQIKVSIAVHLRRFSVVTYAVHGSLIPVIRTLLENTIGTIYNPFVFMLTLVLCILLYIFIDFLRNKKDIRWIKYAY